MISGLKPYVGYKESGQAWIGRIPEHWSLLPNRALFAEVKDRGHPAEEMLSVTITRGVIQQKALLANSSKKDSSNRNRSAYKLVCPGDIAYNKMRAWQGAIGMSQHRGIISPAYVAQRARGDSNPRYFHWLFRTPHFAKEAERWSYGITSDMWSLRPEHFKMIYCAVPPREEQDAIVRLLDHADWQLQRAIRAKKKLIALLNGQKQAISHQAVTRGLDPTVELKTSDVPWLGDIPAHWSISRLKFEASHIVDCLHATPRYSEDGQFPAIRTADIEPGKVRLERARRVSSDHYAQWTSRLAPKEGDILYSREGERFGIAALVPAGIQLCISQRMMVFRVRPPQSSSFLMWQLNCSHVYSQAAADTIGATSPHVNVERIRNFLLVLPPPQEQHEISTWISTHTASLDAAIAYAYREIDLVHEYRVRLTAAIVTGQLDSREVARSLPSEVEEAEVAEAEDETEELLEAVPDDE